MTTQPLTREARDTALDVHGFHRDVRGGYDAIEAMGFDPFSHDDREFGVDWVYCGGHVRAHTAGWCTVSNGNKVPLLTRGGNAAGFDAAAQEEARNLGLRVL